MSFLCPSDFKKTGWEYLILDDISQQTLEKSQLATVWKSLLGCQKVVSLHDKYTKPFQIPFNVPCILLLNRSLSWEDEDWFKKNVVTIRLTEPLF